MPANVFNFALVPPAQRVLYINACGLVWNAYLSYSNTSAAAEAKAEAAGAKAAVRHRGARNM